MSARDEAGDDYAHSPVPARLTIAGWRVGLIVASFSIGLPDFLNGAHNALALGLRDAVVAALVAGAILCVGGSLTAVVSVRTRLSTYLLTRRSFGTGGAALINVLIALIHFCWFGVNAAFFGEALQAAAAANGLIVPQAPLVVLGGVLMTASTIFGFKALDRLALIAVPMLGAVLAAVVFASVKAHGVTVSPAAAPGEPMTLGIAISALIGAYMLAVATMPDLARFIRTSRGAVSAMAISFPVATPLMMTAAAIPALATGETSLMKLVVALGFGTPVLFLLVLPTWTVNALNLYSSSLSLGTTFPGVRQSTFVVIGGVVGTSLALAGILEVFIPFILFLGLIIPPIAAIYVIDAYTRFRGADPARSIAGLPAVRWPALLVWVGSVAAVSLAVHVGRTLTGVPALDATLLAAIAYSVFGGLRQQRQHDGGDHAARAHR